MSAGFEKVQAGMDPQILLVFSVGLLFLTHVRFVLVVDEVNDGSPTVLFISDPGTARGSDHKPVSVVHIISKARRIDYRQLRVQMSAIA